MFFHEGAGGELRNRSIAQVGRIWREKRRKRGLVSAWMSLPDFLRQPLGQDSGRQGDRELSASRGWREQGPNPRFPGLALRISAQGWNWELGNSVLGSPSPGVSLLPLTTCVGSAFPSGYSRLGPSRQGPVLTPIGCQVSIEADQ